MSEVLSKNHYLVKEHLGLFKAANNFDIYDPESGEKVMECREESLSFITKLMRFTDYKRMTPFNIEVKTLEGQLIVRIKRGFSLFLSKVEVLDETGTLLGLFKQKLFSIGGAFTVFDATENPVCELKGKWTGWEFKFLAEGKELAHVSKKWSGLGKELFTSADNYMLEISEAVPADHGARKLILAAVMCIDMVLKE